MLYYKTQAMLKEEIAGFRKSFEDKMVEELDEHKAKIGVLQQLISATL